MMIKMSKTVDGAVDGFTMMKFEAGKHYDLEEMGIKANSLTRALDLGHMLVRAGLATFSTDETKEADEKAEAEAASKAEADKAAAREKKLAAQEAKRLAAAQKLLDAEAAKKAADEAKKLADAEARKKRNATLASPDLKAEAAKQAEAKLPAADPKPDAKE
jgi:hypothetical protein